LAALKAYTAVWTNVKTYLSALREEPLGNARLRREGSIEVDFKGGEN
jgi:hypothetical protein